MPAESTPSVYADLGVKRVICARSSSTVLGGSILSPTVRAAMEEANRIYVGMPELLDRAGESIAELIGAEAAYPTPGCFAAITLGVSGVMTGGAPDLVARLPDTSGLKNEFLIQKCARYQYDRSVTVSGARMIEVGDEAQTTPNQLAQAIGPNTGGIVYAAHQEGEPGILPLSEVVAIAKDAVLPSSSTQPTRSIPSKGSASSSTAALTSSASAPSTWADPTPQASCAGIAKRSRPQPSTVSWPSRPRRTEI